MRGCRDYLIAKNKHEDLQHIRRLAFGYATIEKKDVIIVKNAKEFHFYESTYTGYTGEIIEYIFKR